MGFSFYMMKKRDFKLKQLCYTLSFVVRQKESGSPGHNRRPSNNRVRDAILYSCVMLQLRSVMFPAE
jgi:hypothetical protein